jgi:hypothetical protein
MEPNPGLGVALFMVFPCFGVETFFPSSLLIPFSFFLRLRAPFGNYWSSRTIAACIPTRVKSDDDDEGRGSGHRLFGRDTHSAG